LGEAFSYFLRAATLWGNRVVVSIVVEGHQLAGY
jgi:hypothetical protein